MNSSERPEPFSQKEIRLLRTYPLSHNKDAINVHLDILYDSQCSVPRQEAALSMSKFWVALHRIWLARYQRERSLHNYMVIPATSVVHVKNVEIGYEDLLAVCRGT